MSEPRPLAVNWDRPTSKAGLESLAPLVVGKLNQALPRFLAGQAKAMIAALFTEVQRQPSLLDCTPASLFGAVVQAGQLGLRLGPHLGEAFLVPFSKKATLILGYRGLLQLAYRSGQVRRVTGVAVKAGEPFTVVRGTDQRVEHTPVRNNTGDATDYYVVVELANGGKDFEWFTREEAVRHRDRYATTRNAPKSVRDRSPWYDETPDGGFDQMSLKTLIRRLAKRMPMSVEMNTAVGLDEAAEHDLPQMLEAHIADLGAPPDARTERPETPEDDADALGRD